MDDTSRRALLLGLLLVERINAQIDNSQLIAQAHDAGDAFVAAWNAWVLLHNDLLTSRGELERFKKVLDTFHAFEKLGKQAGY